MIARLLGWLLAILGGLLAIAPASAASCLVAATPVAFGLYNAVSAQDALGAGAVTVTCTTVTGTTSTAFSIVMSAGSGSFTGRTLVAGASKLGYNIYSDAGLSAVWGDGTAGSTVVSDSIPATVLGVAKTYTAYGRIPALQATAAAGIYADSVIVTIAY